MTLEHFYDFMDNLADGWLVVGMVILALMVFFSMRDEWHLEGGKRFEVVLMALVIIAAVYWFGFHE